MNTARHNADIYDDAPEHDVCSKRKAASPTGGFNFTVFCFCPMHGKCWGFHSMPAAEGPFRFLICLFPKSTSWALLWCCLFIEWILNRDPAYFQQTRFWHDLFHGFSHKCPLSLRSSCLPTFDVLDTEICEQFNSFLQNIKSTATHFSKSFLPLPAVHGSYLELQGKWAMGKYQ